ncbi:MAG: hypothetical protein SF097_27115, partial [Acidobacteriota bacterium]|nr:hypothetical protein [Acidobacteriota bacterium]
RRDNTTKGFTQTTCGNGFVVADAANRVCRLSFLQPTRAAVSEKDDAEAGDGGQIEICARRLNGHLQIRVSDDGPGLDPSSLSAGVGLANTQERLRQIYRSDFQFSLAQGEQGGTVVTLEIPFETASENHREKER